MKNVIAYDLTLPTGISDIEAALSKFRLPPMTDLSFRVIGFVPHPEGDGQRLVLPFEGGVSFALQIDEKMIPATYLKKLLNERIAAVCEDENVVSLPRKVKSELKEELMTELLPKAMYKTRVVLAYYHYQTKCLLVDEGSDTWAGLMLNALIKVFDALKTTTVHVTGLDLVLRTLVETTLKEGASGLQEHGIGIGGRVKLKAKKDTVTIDCHDIDVRDSILRLLEEGYTVTEVELCTQDLDVVFTQDFILKRIVFKTEPDIPEDNDGSYYPALTGANVLLVSGLLTTLRKLLGFDTQTDLAA